MLLNIISLRILCILCVILKRMRRLYEKTAAEQDGGIQFLKSLHLNNHEVWLRKLFLKGGGRTYFEHFKKAVNDYIQGLEDGIEKLSLMKQALNNKPELV